MSSRKKIQIHGIDTRDKIKKIERLFEIIGKTSQVGNYPAIAIDETRYIVSRDGQIQVADIDEDSKNFNVEPFKDYRFVSDLSDPDLESFMAKIAEDVKDYKGVMERIKKAEDREEIAGLFVPQLDDDEDLDSDPDNQFLPKLD